MRSQIRPAFVCLILLTLITGLIYPAIVTAIATFAFPAQAAGSIITRHGKTQGSELIGQSFNDPKYFWSRPSATAPVPYAGDNSGGSNLGPTNPALFDAIRQRIARLRAADPENHLPIPVDLVTASASGLDPDISVAAALYQIPRVSRVRQMVPEKLKCLIAAHTQGRTFGVLGEPRINVLKLNLALDELSCQNGGIDAR